MVKPPIKKISATTKVKLKDPGLVFYKPAVRDAVARGNQAQIKALLKAAKDIQKAGGLDGLIGQLETAAARVK